MKKSIKILLILIIIMIIIIPVILIIQLSANKNACIDYEENERRGALIGIKCLDYCLSSDPGCFYACEQYRDKNTLDLSFHGKNCMEINLNHFQDTFIEDFSSCIGKLRENFSLYRPCSDEFIQKYSDIIDLSEFELEPYQRYNLTIEELNCSTYPLEIALKLNEGTDNLRVRFLVNGIFHVPPDDIAPTQGQTKQYFLEYDQTEIKNVSKVELSLKINNTLLAISDKKTC